MRFSLMRKTDVLQEKVIRKDFVDRKGQRLILQKERLTNDVR